MVRAPTLWASYIIRHVVDILLAHCAVKGNHRIGRSVGRSVSVQYICQMRKERIHEHSNTPWRSVIFGVSVIGVVFAAVSSMPISLFTIVKQTGQTDG